jgi:Protein of unknown function (DUF3617)
MHARLTFILTVLTLAPSVCFSQGTDELWETTMTMESEGMSMPAMTQKICKKKGSGQESDSLPLEKDCKVTDSKRSGNKYLYKFACDGKDGKYSGSGETETLGKDAYRGKMKSSGVREGEAFDMSTTFSGKRAGNCTWEDPGKQVKEAQAQSNAMIAKECDKFVAELQPMMIFGGKDMPPDMLMCKDRRKDFCANASKVAKTMGNAAGLKAAAGKYEHWREAMTACGTDPATISGPVCKDMVGKKDWAFVNTYCTTESAELRKAHCAGRDYTTVDANYREMCAQLGGLSEGRSYTSSAPSAENAKPATAAKPAEPAKPTTKDKLKEGTDKLKKFLKF